MQLQPDAASIASHSQTADWQRWQQQAPAAAIHAAARQAAMHGAGGVQGHTIIERQKLAD